jgi:tRNA(Ile)-lysidine synthase
MSGPVVQRIQDMVSERLPAERSVLAVSGGVDSMVLLHAAIATRAAGSIVVATFDHASGPHSAAAVDLVQRVSMSAGVPVVIGQGVAIERPSEAAWREVRLAFLRAVTEEHRAVLCMAHTRDDQVETVLFRELRGAGPRGLAGLAANSPTVRPLLGATRREVVDYAEQTGVEWVDDPTNLDRAFTRNRLRLDIIPALCAVRPTLGDELVEIGERAARWRADLDAAIDAWIDFEAYRDDRSGVRFLDVSRESLQRFSDDTLGVVWPALLARVGIAADWRGTRRLVAFTNRGTTGQAIQLSGGWTVFRRRHGFEVRRDRPTER